MLDFGMIIDDSILRSSDGDIFLIVGATQESIVYTEDRIRQSGKSITLKSGYEIGDKFNLIFISDVQDYNEINLYRLFDLVKPGGVFSGNNYFSKNTNVKSHIDKFMRDNKINFGFWFTSWILYKQW